MMHETMGNHGLTKIKVSPKEVLFESKDILRAVEKQAATELKHAFRSVEPEKLEDEPMKDEGPSAVSEDDIF